MIVRVVGSLWRCVRWLPGARTVGNSFLQTRSGRAFSRWMVRAGSAASLPDVEPLSDADPHLHSSSYGLRRPYPPRAAEYYDTIEAGYAARRGRGEVPVAFVSANTGNYERPIRHEHLLDDADYILVSDGLTDVEGPTRIVAADYFDRDPVRAARFVKTHPHLYAPAAKLIVWIDSNIVIRGDLRPLVEAFLASGRPVGVVPHPERTSVAEEARECIRSRKDDIAVIREQVARYAGIGFETGALVESNLLFLRMDMPQTRRFLSYWWAEIERGSRRDQLSLNYAAQRAGIELFEITRRPDSVRNHPLLAYLHHAANPADDRDADGARDVPQPRFAEVRAERIAAQADAEADIVICVHDALDSTRACLESVRANRSPRRHRLILVDDASGEPTAAYLQEYARTEEQVLLLRNETQQRYTRSANIGLGASAAPLVILLNSDTVVSAGFVEKLADAVATTEGVGIVGPLSNAAGMQSIPQVDSAFIRPPNNALPGGFSVSDMDRWCEANSPRSFPRVPLVHGFCFAVTRAALDAIGTFDEERFPQGYGEEDDLCLRAAECGIGLAIATSTFVYHSGSASYGAGQRSEILKGSRQRLIDIYGERRLYRSVLNLQENPVLRKMRTAAGRISAAR